MNTKPGFWIAAIAMLILAAAPARASKHDFYKGKTIRLIVGSSNNG